MENIWQKMKNIWQNMVSDFLEHNGRSSDIKFGELIGRGSYGSVHQAEWNNETVAVKKLFNSKNENYFDIEVKQLKRVSHPNIIKLLGTASDKENLYIILEYAEGGTLHELIHDSSKVYCRYDALNWAQQIAEGVAYLHSRTPKPLLHRDLKPDNILLKKPYNGYEYPTPNVIICDFGTVAEVKTNMTREKGTHRYVAPEVFESNTYNEKCDVYSWAIVLWEIIERRQPFKNIENIAIGYQVCSKKARPTFFVEWKEPIRELVRLCWDQEPIRRPTSQEVVDFILSRCDLKAEGAAVEQSPYPLFIIDESEINFKEISPCGMGADFDKAKWKNKDIAIFNMIKYDENMVRKLSQLQHPNLIRLFGTIERKNLVFEFEEGDNFREFLHGIKHSNINYTLSMALNWAQQYAEGLDYININFPSNFTCRGLSTYDLLLTNDRKQIKICNFFVALPSVRSIPAYMAPEYINDCNYDEKCDSYSWAILFWEILARKEPFGEDSYRGVPGTYTFLRYVNNFKRPPLLHNWPEAIKDLIRSSWNSCPDERPSLKAIVIAIDNLRKNLKCSKILDETIRSPLTLDIAQKYRRHVETRYSNVYEK